MFNNGAVVTAQIVDENAVLRFSGTLASLGAAVAVTLDDEDGNPVTYLDGNYRGTVANTTTWGTTPSPISGEPPLILEHTLTITATSGSIVNVWSGEVQVRRRGLTE